MNEKKQVWMLIYCYRDNPELNRLVHGVWDSYKGCKEAYDFMKKERPDFDYGIASYYIYGEGEGYA